MDLYSDFKNFFMKKIKNSLPKLLKKVVIECRIVAISVRKWQKVANLDDFVHG